MWYIYKHYTQVAHLQVQEEKLQEANIQNHLCIFIFKIFTIKFSIIKLCNILWVNFLINKHNNTHALGLVLKETVLSGWYHTGLL